MASFSGGQYVQPGVFSNQLQATTPVIPGGVRVAALIGSVIPTISVTGEAVTHGTFPNAIDALAHTAVSLGSTIQDANFVTYTLGVDYILGTGGNAGKVDWSSPDNPASMIGTEASPYTGLSTKTFIFNVTTGIGGSPVVTPLSVAFTSETTVAAVVTTINTAYGDTIASASGSYLLLSTGTLGSPVTKNASISIGTGTANSILGFVGGTIAFSSQEPQTGVVYYANYTYNKATADYGVSLAFSLNDVISYAGPLAVDGSNNPLYTLPVAAQIAINNGASVLYLVGLNPADGAYLTQFEAAINKLQAVSCNIVVPITSDAPTIPTAQAVWAYSKAQVDALSSTLERKERTTYVGTVSTDVATCVSQAEALADKRVIFCYNSQPTYFVGTSLTPSILEGSFTAAAIAGIRTNPNFDVAEPLTHKALIGFATFPDTTLQNQKNTLASNGVLVVSNTNGANPIVMDGTSTLTATVDDQEISVTEATDFVIQTVRTLLEAIYVGQKILPDTPSQVVSTTGAILTDLENLTIINGFSGVSATVDSGNPSQIDLSFTILSVYELKWIYITFGLAL